MDSVSNSASTVYVVRRRDLQQWLLHIDSALWGREQKPHDAVLQTEVLAGEP